MVIGNSFARDWVNVLLESKFKDSLEISYNVNIEDTEEFKNKVKQADRIYFSELDIKNLDAFLLKFDISKGKVWNVGTKNFGKNNGLIYNSPKDSNYCSQRIKMVDGFYEKNEFLKSQWGNNFVDLIGMVIDEKGFMPVFTGGCKFISGDTTHLTEFGAKYFAEILNKKQTL